MTVSGKNEGVTSSAHGASTAAAGLSREPQLFLLGNGEAICCNPSGRFHGWLMRQHPDGQWVSVRKLDETKPW